MSKNITILKDSLLRLKFLQSASDATDVSFIMKNDETEAVSSYTETYVSGEAVVEITDTSVIGTYSYQINEETPEGILKYRTGNCKGEECSFGKLVICESLDEEE